MNLTMPVPVKKTSERAELLGFFLDNLLDKKGKKYKPGYIAMKLAHLEVKDLYYMQSEVKDRMNRGENWQAWFWWSLKVK
jgi:hypothetical protein